MSYSVRALVFETLAVLGIFAASVHCSLAQSIRPANSYTPDAEITERISETKELCKQRHVDRCALLPRYEALKRSLSRAERQCKLPPASGVRQTWPAFQSTNPGDGACKLRDGIYKSIIDARSYNIPELAPVVANSSSSWDYRKPFDHVDKIPETAWTELKSRNLVPTDSACIQYTGNINYMQAIIIIQNTRDEFAAAGIHDEASCNSGKQVAAAIAAKYNPIAGKAVEQFGDCVCKGAYK